MVIYRILWSTVVCVLAVAAVPIAFSYLPWGALLALAVGAVIVGPLVDAGIRARGGHGPRFASSVRAAAITVVGVLAVSGLLALLNTVGLFAVGLLGVGLLAVSALPVLRHLLARAHRGTRPGPQLPVAPAATSTAPGPVPASAPTPAPTPPPPSCHALTDAELCWRWRTSFIVLQRSVSPGERLRLVQTRAALLDELARRHPAGFRCWLDSGARAASDPTRFITTSHPRCAQVPQQRHDR